MDIYKCATSAEKKFFINPAAENFFPKNCYIFISLPSATMIPNKIVGKNIDSNFFDSLYLTRMTKLSTPVDNIFLVGSFWPVPSDLVKSRISVQYVPYVSPYSTVKRIKQRKGIFLLAKFFVCWIHNANDIHFEISWWSIDNLPIRSLQKWTNIRRLIFSISIKHSQVGVNSNFERPHFPLLCISLLWLLLFE